MSRVLIALIVFVILSGLFTYVKFVALHEWSLPVTLAQGVVAVVLIWFAILEWKNFRRTHDGTS